MLIVALFVSSVTFGGNGAATANHLYDIEYVVDCDSPGDLTIFVEMQKALHAPDVFVTDASTFVVLNDTTPKSAVLAPVKDFSNWFG